MDNKTTKVELTDEQLRITLKALEHYIRWRDSNGFSGPKDASHENAIRKTRKIFKDIVYKNTDE